MNMSINATKMRSFCCIILLAILTGCIRSTGPGCLPTISTVSTMENAEIHMRQKDIISKKIYEDNCPAEEYPYHIYNGSDD